MNRKGFTPIAIALMVALGMVVLGGALYWISPVVWHGGNDALIPIPEPTSTTPITPIATSTPPNGTSTPPAATSTPAASVSIYSITPTSGPVGTEVTIDGFGFTQDNTIHFGYGVVLHVAASSGGPAYMCALGATDCHPGVHQRLTFTVPSQLDPACAFSTPRCMLPTQMTQPGAYAVSVSNANGTSDSESFTVTTATTTSVGLSLAPTSGLVGSTVTITGSGFAATGNQVTFNGMVSAPLTDLSSPEGKTLTFAVPDTLGPNCKESQPCPMYLMLVSTGTYQVDVTTNGITRAVGPFTVTGGGQQIPQ